MFIAIEENFSFEIIKKLFYNMKKAENTIIHTFYSKSNNLVRAELTMLGFRVIVHSDTDSKNINGIIEGLNLSGKIMLFYNYITYTNGLDLIYSIGLKYNKPILVISEDNKTKLFYNSKLEINNCIEKFINFKCSKKTNINYELINYNRIIPVRGSYNRNKMLFKLMTTYDKINENRQNNKIVLIDCK